MTHEDFITGLCHEFELAFISTGLEPVKRAFGDGDNDGCMVTALDVSEHGNTRRSLPNGFWESIKYEYDSLENGKKRVRRVVEFFAAKYPEFDQAWWQAFVSYCIGGYDGCATYPLQWMKRTRDELVGVESPKLMGAAVGGLVQRRVFAAAKVENYNGQSNHTHTQSVQGYESEESPCGEASKGSVANYSA